MAGILTGTPVLLQIQSFRKPAITRFMKFISFLGEEDFYTLLIPFVIWICDFKMGCLLSILMAFGFYIGGFLKNLLCLPRPPSPPVIPADKCQDWALPSHHAILNVSVPWYIWIYMYTHFDLPMSVIMLAFVGMSFWCFSILFSRLYLGIHSPADVLVGGVLGCLVLLFWLLVEEFLEKDVLFSKQFSFLFIVLTLGLLSLHPDPHPKSFIISETANMMSASVGIIFGACTNECLGLNMESSLYFEHPSLFGIVGRYFIGMIVILAAKFVIGFVVEVVMTTSLSLIGLPFVYIKRVSEVTSEVVHYSPDRFIVLDKVSRES